MTASCLTNMSPHFYILYFFICVKWSVCYEYYEKDINTKRNAKKSIEENQGGRPNKIHKNLNAEFDLASFLNVEDEVSLGGGNEKNDYNVNGEHNLKEYNDYGSVVNDAAENIKKRDDSSDFFNGAYNQGETNVNPLELKNMVNGRQFNTAGLNEKLVNNKDDKAVTSNLQDELSVEKSLIHHPEKKCEHNLKEYNDYGSVVNDAAENIKKRDDSSDFFNGAYNQGETNVNPLELKNMVNGRQFNTAGLNEKLVNNKDDKAVTSNLQDELSVEKSLIHHPEKKCSFKNMKFPFFSHNKSQTRKKAKKKKMFCLKCKKKNALTTSTEGYETKNKNKRSYVEKLCPECQRKFRAEVNENIDDGKRRLNQRMVHNSRQYFAAIDSEAKYKPINHLLKMEDDNSADIPISQYVRRKRDEFEDRDRRLQELDLIQKKVDNLEIHMPRFEKPIQL